MLTLEFLKNYLVIPVDMTEGVDWLLLKFCEVAKLYLSNAIDDFDVLYAEDERFRKQADEWMLFYVAELYQNRNIYAEGTEPSYQVMALMIQLQTYNKEHIKAD